MKFLQGLVVGVLISIFCVVFVIEKSHLDIEKIYDVKWCVMLDEHFCKTYGNNVRIIFNNYAINKVFNYRIQLSH